MASFDTSAQRVDVNTESWWSSCLLRSAFSSAIALIAGVDRAVVGRGPVRRGASVPLGSSARCRAKKKNERNRRARVRAAHCARFDPCCRRPRCSRCPCSRTGRSGCSIRWCSVAFWSGASWSVCSRSRSAVCADRPRGFAVAYLMLPEAAPLFAVATVALAPRERRLRARLGFLRRYGGNIASSRATAAAHWRGAIPSTVTGGRRPTTPRSPAAPADLHRAPIR